MDKISLIFKQALGWIKAKASIYFQRSCKVIHDLKSNFILIKSLITGGIVVVIFAAVIFMPGILQRIIVPLGIHHPKYEVTDSISFEKEKAALVKEIAKLEKKMNAFTPKSHYLIINSTNNEFSLMKGNQLVRSGKCSTGSYLLLENGDNQKWLFKTPKGELRVKDKKTFPIWKKPDWAFIEEGLPVPSPNHDSRFEYGVLGDYALILGHGYMIHGTLYQRFLGMPVTHGCVRLNDDDLKKVYQSMDVGSKVYVY